MQNLSIFLSKTLKDYSVKNRIILFLIFTALLIGTGTISCSISSANKQGENLYKHNCSTCHGDNGEGLRNLYPPIANADYLQLHRTELSCIIKNGITHPIIVNGKNFHMPMPAQPPQFSAPMINPPHFSA